MLRRVLKLNKRKKIFILTILFLMLVGLTAITATSTDNNTLIETMTINEDTNIKEVVSSYNDDIQETTIYEETINDVKTQNLKTDRIETANNYVQLSDYLTSNDYDTVTVNIGDNIQLTGNISVSLAIKNLTINGNGKTINGINKYSFLNVRYASVFINNINLTKLSYGGIYSQGNNLTLKNTNFTESTYCIDNHNSNITVINSSFIKNDCSLYLWSSNIIIDNCSFLNNRDNEAIFTTYSDITINNTKFIGNYNPNSYLNYGGAITLHYSPCLIVNSEFIDNHANSSGGAISAERNYLIIDNSSFINNSAGEYGGAINIYEDDFIFVDYINKDSYLKINNTSFYNNSATWGGALHVYNLKNNSEILNSKFNNNKASFGGAISDKAIGVYTIYNSNLIIDNADITNNTATYGGAINANGNVSITQSNLLNNKAGYGGVIDATINSNITIFESNLSNNNATYGGVIYATTNILTVTQSNFKNNNAIYGGVVHADTKSNITILQSGITNNHATDGGAIYTATDSNMTIIGSNITSNTATSSGGVITCMGGSIILKNSTVWDNCVTTSSAYVVDLGGANSINIIDNLFVNNTDNSRDMLFSNAKTGAQVDIHGNTYIDNFLEDTIIELDVSVVTDNERRSYNYDINVTLREIYNDTVHNGTLHVYINGILTDTTEVVNGCAGICFENNDLTKRENNITLEYISQGKHYQNTTTNFTVKKMVNTTLSIQAPSIMNAGDVAVINFTLVDVTNNPLGNETVCVFVDEEQVATLKTDSNGVVNYTFIALGDENVRIGGTYHTSSDSFYLSAMDAEAVINVTKIQPEIIIVAGNITPEIENNITIYLMDKSGNPIKNKTLTVNITEEGEADITATVTTDENGIAVFNFTPVNEGTLNINVTCQSDDLYHYTSASVQASKNFITTNIIVTVTPIKINQTNTISIEVLPSDGTLISGTLEIDIDGKLHNLTINNGRATYPDYKSSTAGEKVVTAIFTSSTPGYANAITSREFYVGKLPVCVAIEAVNHTAGNVTLKVSVFPENNTGSTVDGGNIVIKSIDRQNRSIIYNDTLVNGELIYLTDINEIGWYEFATVYYGNAFFLGKVNMKSIEVLPVPTSTVTFDKTALVGSNITLNASVTDIYGNPVNDGNVTFLVDGTPLYHANGTPVEAKVENGMATTEYTLPTTYNVGKHVIKAKYHGNTKYNISSDESELKVRSYSVVTVDPLEDVALDNVTFTAHVVDYQGRPVNGGYIIFKVSGKTLSYENGTQIRTPVENGIVELSYRADSNWIVDYHPDLTVEAIYSGTSIVSQNRSNTTKITIYKRNATINVNAPDDYVNGTLHINAVVRDQNGSLINEGNLIFKLNGLSLKDENNKAIITHVVNGRVHIDVKLPFTYSAKKYNLTAVYSNKIYNKATGLNTTHLKAIPTYVNATVTIKDEFTKPVVTGQIYNKFHNAILEETTFINIKFDGISYTKKVKVNNGTFNETLKGISIYKAGTHKVEITTGSNSHYQGVRKTITTTPTPKYNVNIEFINIKRNKTTTIVQAKIVDDKNKNVQKNIKITIKLNGKSFLINQSVINGNIDVLVDTSTLKNRNYTLELVSGANTYYNAGKGMIELPKY